METTSIEDWNPKSIAEAYRSRWGIETEYRVKKDFLALTTSPSPVVRYLFLFLSVVLYNAWVLASPERSPSRNKGAPAAGCRTTVHFAR